MPKPTQADFNETHRSPVVYHDRKGKAKFLIISPEYDRTQAREIVNEYLDDHTITATSWGYGHVSTDQIQTYDVGWRKNPDGKDMEFCVVLDGGGMYRAMGVKL